MRSRFGTGIDLAPAALADIRRASDELREKARNFPAPCGCTPRIRCDRHCRVKIRSQLEDGRRRWYAACNGPHRPREFDASRNESFLGALDWADDHTIKHRTWKGGTDA